jgi:hypothetical protein
MVTCTKCKHQVVLGYKRCSRCRERDRIADNIRRRRNIRSGLCGCGRSCALNHKKCQSCLNEGKLLRTRYKAEGRCVSCGSKPIYPTCDRCRSCISKIMLRDYGISVDDYETILLKQKNGCAICGQIPTNKKLTVDHDHKTGQVRGLLCSLCNMGLGLFKDNVSRLATAIQYLSSSGGVT